MPPETTEQEITNANDVVLTVTGDSSHTAGAAGKLMVADFSFAETRDDTLKSGVGNHGPIGITHGNVEYEFSLTLEGEDADLFDDIYRPADDSPNLQVTATGDEYKHIFHHVWPTNIEYSGSDGDAVEVSIDALTTEPTRERA